MSQHNLPSSNIYYQHNINNYQQILNDYQHNINNYQHNIPSNLLWPGAKITLSVFTFPLDGISDAGRSLLEYATQHPWRFGIAAALIIGGVLFLTLPTIVGFGEMGPVEGSLAALWQSWIGNVVKGSLFACLQSLAMTGVFDTIGAAMTFAGVAAGYPISVGSRNYPGGRVVVPAAAFAAYVGFLGI